VDLLDEMSIVLIVEHESQELKVFGLAILPSRLSVDRFASEDGDLVVKLLSSYQEELVVDEA